MQTLSHRVHPLRLAALVLAGSLVVLAGCGGSSNKPAATPAPAPSQPATAPAPQPKEYTFASMLPLTGKAAATGETEQKAISLEIERINKSGMLPKGVTINSVFEDHQADPKVGVTVLNKVITVNHTNFGLTGYSSLTLAQVPIAEQNKFVLLNAGAQTPTLAGASPWLFNTVPLTDQQAKALLYHVIKNKGMKKIALLFRDDDLGRGVEKHFKEQVEKLGGTMAAAEMYAPNTTDYRLALAKLRDSNPDALYIAGIATETGAIINQAKSIGFKTQFLSYSAYEHESTIKLGGDYAEGGLYTAAATTDDKGTPYPETVAFEKAWKDKGYGENQLDYAAYQYAEATDIYAGALKYVLDKGQEATGDNLRNAMLNITVKSVYGTIRFTNEGTVLKPLLIKTLKNGKWEVVSMLTLDQIAAIP